MLVLRYLTIIATSCLLPATLAADESQPAVDGVTGKLSIEGGNNHIDASGKDIQTVAIDGKLTTNFGELTDSDYGRMVALVLRMRSGMSFDEGNEVSSTFGFFGLAWQDPDLGSFGPDITYGESNKREFYQLGGHVAGYLGPLTLRGVVRYFNGEAYPDEAWFFRGVGTLYVTENFSVNAGFNYTDFQGAPDIESITSRVEYMAFPDNPIGISLYGQSAYRVDDTGADNYQIQVGVSFYFSRHGKSLVRRQREDNL